MRNTKFYCKNLYLLIKHKTMYNQLISPKVYTLETDRSGRTTKKINRYGQSTPNPSRPTPTPPTPSVGDFLLLEDGFYMLTEDNFKITL